MKYGFLHTAAVSPALHVADCAYNTRQIIAAMRAQAVAGTKLLCLPEFTLTGFDQEIHKIFCCLRPCPWADGAPRGDTFGQYRIILSADTASEVRQMPSQKRR